MVEGDPYRILGVDRHASLAEVRLAFRRAALDVHPDNRPDDPATAEREFRRLTEAYQAVLRVHVEVDPVLRIKLRHSKHFTPQQFAMLDIGWVAAGPKAGLLEDHPDHRCRQRKCSYATRDEGLIFLCFWLVAMAVSMTATFFLAQYLMSGYMDSVPPGDMLLLVLVSLGIYGLIVVSAVTLLMLSRRVFWLTMALMAKYCLPAPARADRLPHGPPQDELPPQA